MGFMSMAQDRTNYSGSPCTNNYSQLDPTRSSAGCCTICKYAEKKKDPKYVEWCCKCKWRDATGAHCVELRKKQQQTLDQSALPGGSVAISGNDQVTQSQNNWTPEPAKPNQYVSDLQDIQNAYQQGVQAANVVSGVLEQTEQRVSDLNASQAELEAGKVNVVDRSGVVNNADNLNYDNALENMFGGSSSSSGKEEEDLDDGYDDLIKRADAIVDELRNDPSTDKRPWQASQLYLSATFIRPQEQYPKDMIFECDHWDSRQSRGERAAQKKEEDRLDREEFLERSVDDAHDKYLGKGQVSDSLKKEFGDWLDEMGEEPPSEVQVSEPLSLSNEKSDQHNGEKAEKEAAAEAEIKETVEEAIAEVDCDKLVYVRDVELPRLFDKAWGQFKANKDGLELIRQGKKELEDDMSWAASTAVGVVKTINMMANAFNNLAAVSVQGKIVKAGTNLVTGKLPSTVFEKSKVKSAEEILEVVEAGGAFLEIATTDDVKYSMLQIGLGELGVMGNSINFLLDMRDDLQDLDDYRQLQKDVVYYLDEFDTAARKYEAAMDREISTMGGINKYVSVIDKTLNEKCK